MSELPEGWVEAKLSAVATARMGKTILSKELVASGLPVFSASVGSEPWGYVDDWSTVFPRGTLVISARGTIGDVKLPDHDFFVSTQTTIALQPSGAVVPSFLRILLSAFDWPSVTATTAIPMLTIGKLDEVGVVVPPLAEQRRIVAKLDALTARTARARADLDRIPGLAARYKQAVLAKAFRGELTASWRRAVGGDKPWLEVSIGEIAEITSGFGFPKDRQGLTEGDFPFAKVSDISKAVAHDGGMLSRAANYVLMTDLATLKAKPVPSGSVVFAKIGEALRLNRRALTTTDVILDNNCMALSPDLDRIAPRFLYQFMKTVDLSPFAVATAVPSVRRGDVACLRLPLPSMPEQLEIDRRIEAAFAEIDRLAAEASSARRLLDRLDQAVLAKAFRGELVPQDPADEPASVLLDRIRAERASAPKATRGRRKAAS